MLSQSYMSIQEFKRKISDITTIKELKDIAKEYNIEMSIHLAYQTGVSSVIEWNLLKDTFRVNVLINLNVTMVIGKETFSIPILLIDESSSKFLPKSLEEIEEILVMHIKKSLDKF